MHMESSVFVTPDLPAPMRMPTSQEVSGQLHRLLASKYFRTSPRLRRFLSFTVDQALTGLEGRLKEYCIALEVFGKPESFDPRIDSSVRVAARQLRAKLDAYYIAEGTQDDVLIRFRAGDYVPRFYVRTLQSRNGEVPFQNTCEPLPVLVVEKERATVRPIIESLDILSYPIAAIVEDAEEALEFVGASGDVLVMTGFVLAGGMNGLELTRALRETSNTPTVFIAPANPSLDVLTELVHSNPDAVIYRPVRQTDVETAVRLATAKCRSLQTHSFGNTCVAGLSAIV